MRGAANRWRGQRRCAMRPVGGTRMAGQPFDDRGVGSSALIVASNLAKASPDEYGWRRLSPSTPSTDDAPRPIPLRGLRGASITTDINCQSTFSGELDENRARFAYSTVSRQPVR